MPKRTRRYGARRQTSYYPNFNRYEELKADWLSRHPNATRAQYELAMREIAAKCGI